LDRQDIDALLVGALYGELSSSDEAILTAHLESHPVDRTALDDLKTVRAKWKASRIFELQLEPPQAVSALLLQEAARRAPKIEQRSQDQKESWFKRFVTSFVAHPAMAAAATLVLVVGVAGTLYLKGDRPVAEQTVAQDESITRLPTPTTPPPPVESMNGVVAAGSAAAAYKTDPASKNDEVDVKLAETDEGQDRAKGGKAPSADPLKQEAKKDTEKNQKAATHAAAPSRDLAFGNNLHEERPATQPAKPADVVATDSRRQYVEVGRNDHAPKELERPNDDASGATGGALADGDTPRQTGPGTGAAATVNKPRGAAPPPPPPAPVVAAAPSSTPQAPAAKTPAPAPNPELAWAKTEHAHVTQLVKDGKCQEAAPFAIAIKNRAPEYYATNVATDRALKPCMPYITDTSERTEKAAAKRATDTK
jgi:hypothetical protein